MEARQIKRAICSIACGSPAYFQYAFNLAVSLKYHKSKIPFVLICFGPDGYDSIKPYQHIFDRVIWLNEADKMPFFNKTRIHHYMAEYGQYLFVDADTIAIQNPDSIFEDTTPFKATLEKSGTKGNHNIRVAWAIVDELYDHYGINPKNVFSEINSSTMLVTRCELSNDIFTLAEHFYACEWYQKATRLGPHGKASLGHMPDELAFETAMLFMNYANQKWRPIYTHYQGTKTPPLFISQVQKKSPSSFFWTMPGNSGNVNGMMWKEYEKYCRAYTVQLASRDYVSKTALGNGFKPGKQQKAANGLNITQEYKGIRKRERPKLIQDIIDKYAQSQENNSK